MPDTTLPSLTPLWIVLVSMLAAGLIAAFGRMPNLRDGVSIVAAIVKFSLVASLLPGVLSGKTYVFRLLKISEGIDLALATDTLGMLFALLSSFLWIVASIYSIGYMRAYGEKKHTRFFVFFALSLSATMGIAFASNLLTFVIFFEMLSLVTYPLVIHKETPAALAAGRKYLVYTLGAGLALLLGAAWAYELTGTMDFTAGGFLAGSASLATLRILFWVFVLGFAVKAALMPLHGWLPSAMVAPTPVSGLLHAVAVVKAGAFAGLRILGYVFGPELLGELGTIHVVSYIAAASIILASLIAMRQDNLKLRLAYSTVAHLCYITLGATLLGPLAWFGAAFHIVNHAFMKITLFFCAGAVQAVTHKENVSQLDGVGRQMPLTMAAFAAASLGLAGLPPLGGFVSKWYLGAGAAEAGIPAYGWVLLISGMLNAAYLFPIVYRAFFRPLPTATESDHGIDHTSTERTPLGMMMAVPLSVAALIAVALGLVPEFVPGFWSLSADSVLQVMGVEFTP